jgi:hypothetical protein
MESARTRIKIIKVGSRHTIYLESLLKQAGDTKMNYEKCLRCGNRMLRGNYLS